MSLNCCWRVSKSDTSEVINTGKTIKRLKSSTELTSFSYDDLSKATKNFEVKLGEGGFGEVYKGVLQPSKQQGRLHPVHIAVKRLSVDSKQGLKEFEAEVKIFSRIRHKNLVELLGWCLQRGSSSRHVMLVYEFVPNKSLDYLLHRNKESEKCKWSRRFKILSEVADALVYLHQDWAQTMLILHRDIKPSNIMLDESYNPKLGDFGLSRKLEKGTPYYKTARVGAPMFGTKGYIAPELLLDDKFTKETDMYSFGVVMLEVASGKRPLECIDYPTPTRSYHNSTQPLIESVWDLYHQGRLLEAADKRLHHMFNETQMKRVLIAGLACCHPDPQARLTIKEAVHVLSGVAELPCIPSAMPPPPNRLSVQQLYDVAFGSLDEATTSSTAATNTSDYQTAPAYKTVPVYKTAPAMSAPSRSRTFMQCSFLKVAEPF